MSSQEHWSLEQYQEYQKNKGKRSKYGASKTKIDGHTFDSQKEAEFYSDLKFRAMAGEIAGFCLQPRFILAPGLEYRADFIVFNNNGSFEIIDVKGFKTKEYIAKKKVLEDKYNLKIREI
ncbi:MAG: DUF1064 domain-containing protein [Clostridia bacterium]|nr:DUF1064 domain-containing protein [Clostridia bacterium]